MALQGRMRARSLWARRRKCMCTATGGNVRDVCLFVCWALVRQSAYLRLTLRLWSGPGAGPDSRPQLDRAHGSAVSACQRVAAAYNVRFVYIWLRLWCSLFCARNSGQRPCIAWHLIRAVLLASLLVARVECCPVVSATPTRSAVHCCLLGLPFVRQPQWRRETRARTSSGEQ